ncbi:MAG: hypothetical protein WC619_03130 [Patescibacteria group bacterium]
MFGFKTTNQLAISLIFVLLFSGCNLKDAGSELKKLDDKVGQKLDQIQEKQQEDVVNFFNEEKIAPAAKDLTKEQKEKIDKWLEKNNLNRYGDSVDMMYTGGTPLFNETTGESLDRYDYILKNHPELLDELK